MDFDNSMISCGFEIGLTMTDFWSLCFVLLRGKKFLRSNLLKSFKSFDCNLIVIGFSNFLKYLVISFPFLTPGIRIEW